MAIVAGSEKASAAANQKKVRSPKSHPPYLKMINDVIAAMKERSGSSQIAIAKFIEENNKKLLSNFMKFLLVQLRRLVASGKLVKVKASFKIPYARPAPGEAVVTKKKKTTKPATAVKVVAKPKVVKAKPEAAAAKTVVAPSKKQKAGAAKKVVKVAKNNAKSTPGEKKTVNAKKLDAAVVAKKVNKPITNTRKAKNVKSPVKKAAAKKPRSVTL